MIGYVDAPSRVDAYRSDEFQREVGDVLERDHREIRTSINAMLDNNRVPIRSGPPGGGAVTMEAARLLCAIASRQVKATSVVRVAERILSMTYQCDIADDDHDVHAETTPKRRGTFGDDLADAILEVWKASDGVGTALPFPPNVVIEWNDGGSVLYGRLRLFKNRTSLYSTAAMPVAPGGPWTFVHTDGVGGSFFTAIALLGFVECFRDAVRAEADDDEE
ncbi:MAG: hypothetical protein NT113_04300 [Hyphomicrobiales bacterium]|jgi:hypothetical protein|nr:hypothetical protein [Hyphomicrobiales bacterium]